jgi:RNA polymerase sigma-70 factor (ECF subfamily)
VWHHDLATPAGESVPEQDQRARDARQAEEAALVFRVRDGDQRAIEDLHARYSGPLFSLAYQVTGSDRYSQDVVQEVFIALWRDASRFDPERGAVSSWLFALARHKAIDLVRKEATIRRRTADLDLSFEEAPDDVDREAWMNIRRDRVREAMATLPELQKQAVELAFFSGLTHVEVAEHLGIPLGTAKTRIRTGLLRLRDLLGDSLSEHEDAGNVSRDAIGSLPGCPRPHGRRAARAPRRRCAPPYFAGAVLRNASTSTRGRPEVPTILTSSVWLPDEDHAFVNTTRRTSVAAFRRSTVVASFPSM